MHANNRALIANATLIVAFATGCSSADPIEPLEASDGDDTRDAAIAPQYFGNANDPPPDGSLLGRFGASHAGDGALPPPSRVEREGGDVGASLAETEFLADAGDGWLSLIEADWELAPGTETHLCVRATVPRDVLLHEFTPINPLGTHHTVLSVHPGGALDGVVLCGADVSGRNLYSAGVGTEPWVLPEGVATRVSAGEQLMLNLHLFNTGGDELRGRSGVLVRTLGEAEVEHEAGALLAGPIMLEIPPGRSTVNGQCTFFDDATIFGVAPHMHQLGVHMKVVANSSDAGVVVLFDGPFSFESQLRYPVDFVAMKTGDTVDVACTYENDTDGNVLWGDSSLSEMCFASINRFPSHGTGYVCVN